MSLFPSTALAEEASATNREIDVIVFTLFRAKFTGIKTVYEISDLLRKQRAIGTDCTINVVPVSEPPEKNKR